VLIIRKTGEIIDVYSIGCQIMGKNGTKKQNE